jgi:hypothetical protein
LPPYSAPPFAGAIVNAHEIDEPEGDGADSDSAIKPPRAAGILGLEVLELVSERPLASTWRARVLDGPLVSPAGMPALERGKIVALIVVSERASVTVRERFANTAEDLQATGDAVSGILRVHAVAPSRDALVADLWTTGTAVDLSALRWSLRRRLELVCRVAHSLETLHAMGFAHGCLCPENVLLDDDLHPVLSEVGLAPPAVVAETRAYADYASPEVKAGEAPSAGSDVYSVGRLLQEVVKGSETKEVNEIVRTCLAPPTLRYASAADLERALSAVAAKLPPEGSPAAASPAPRRGSEPDLGQAAAGRAAARPARERDTKPENAVPAAGRPAVARPSALGRRSPMVGVAGLLGVAVAIGGAYLLGGSDPSLRVTFMASLALSGAAATWLLPSVEGRAVATRLLLAAGCAALIVTLDPLARIYASAAQRRIHGTEASRRGAIEEILRLGRDFRGISLAGVDLSGLDLTGADLRGVDLSRADLSHTRLWGAVVDGASFDGARLEGADLDRAALETALVGSAVCDASTRLPAGWSCKGSRIVR